MTIYEIVKNKKNISDNEKKRQLKSYFVTNISYIRQITKNKELDNFKTSMGLLFNHLKYDILTLLADCVSQEQKQHIQLLNYYNINWNKYIFDIFINLGIKDIPLWFFFHIPYFWDDIKNITHNRLILDQMLDYAINEWPNDLYFTEQEFIHNCNQTCLMYAITYQNQNNSSILSKYCSLLRKINPWINYQSPNIGSKFLSKNHIRPQSNTLSVNCRKICFISDSFVVDSCVFRDRMGLIGQLFKKNNLDIYFASFYDEKHIQGDISKLFFKKIKDKYICLDRNITKARNTIDSYQFDIIIYPDIGMKLYPYILSFSKLAPIQINTWGHSETSGVDTIDYFITSKYFHPSKKISNGNIQNEFSEKIVVFNSLSTYYLPPTILFNINTKEFKTKKDFNFETKHKLYGCLQTSYKINPEFETCLLMILKKDPNAYILLSNAIPFCQSHLKRLKNKFGSYLSRIRWFPTLDKFHYMEIISLCDIILDPFPFGGCNTSFEAFDLNIPVVTLPSQYLSGNFTVGLYKKMGIIDTIAVSIEDYVNKCFEIVYNQKLRNKIVREIHCKKDTIFLEKESVEEWYSFLMKC